MTCPKCQSNMKSSFCRECGYPIIDMPTPRKVGLRWNSENVILVVGFILLIGGVEWLVFISNPKTKLLEILAFKMAVINLCFLLFFIFSFIRDRNLLIGGSLLKAKLVGVTKWRRLAKVEFENGEKITLEMTSREKKVGSVLWFLKYKNRILLLRDTFEWEVVKELF